ncbi:hypothetical protein [Brevibacterium casei]|uniref:hypothetical protein n=1 Tax=Brevibacterium casei TaxID=33889 RepID=UPI001C9004D2|nr:hypothetical protein [Brevibacterium casei]
MTARKSAQFVETAAESLTIAIKLFNRPSPTGREQATIIMVAHSFEMLLNSAT